MKIKSTENLILCKSKSWQNGTEKHPQKNPFTFYNWSVFLFLFEEIQDLTGRIYKL